MLSPQQLYPLLLTWVQALQIVEHATAQQALAHLLTALLVGQSLRPSALMRALLSPQPVPARQRYKRVQRALDRPWLTPAWLTPVLVRAAVALVAPVRPLAGLSILVLDSVRVGRWDLFTLGVTWHGRVLPLGWAVLPYPWPKGTFTPTVCALIRQVAAAWPADRPVHLVADRAFPSYELFHTLRAVGWGWTVRLQARHWVTVGGQTQQARQRLATAQEGWWTTARGAYGCGKRAVAGTVVVGRGLVVLPWHQRRDGSLRQRARRLGRRRQHAASKNLRRTADADPWVILFTTQPTAHAARLSYRCRWPVEGAYRDAQTGWDGQHGWELSHGAARLSTAEAVARLAGLWALGTLVQSWIGQQTVHGSVPPQVRGVVASWTTTGRLSIWARGRLVLTEPSGQLAAWLVQVLVAGARRIAAMPPLPVPRASSGRRPRPTRQAA